MYFPIKAGHKMGARTKSLWVGTPVLPACYVTILACPRPVQLVSHPIQIGLTFTRITLGSGQKHRFGPWSDPDQSTLSKSAYLVIVLYSIVDDSMGYEPGKEPPQIREPHCLRFYAPVPFLSFSFLVGSMSESQSVNQRLMFSRSWAYPGHIWEISLAYF